MKVSFSSSDGKREVDVQVDDSDLKSLDHTLSLIIYPALVSFKEKTKFAPLSMYPPDFIPYKEKTESVDEYEARMASSEKIAFDRWTVAVDQMIFAFRMVSAGDPTWEYDTLQNKRVQDGLDLFATHFRNLWV